MQLRDRHVWLIGASSGIGEALAERLASEGCSLALSARNEEALERVAATARAAGAPEVHVVPLDVTEVDALPDAVRRLHEVWDTIDILIYGAGQWQTTEVADFDVEAIELQIAVNYIGLVRAIGAVLPEMRDRRSGEIVGIASVAGYNGMPRAAGYGSTKSAIITLLQSLRLELPAYGVGITTVNPGFVDTEPTRRNDFPMPFMLTPEVAADRIVRGLLAGRAEIHFPRRLSIPLKLLGALPRPLYERIIRLTVRKRPRP